jgi:hypothetical protein
MAATSSLVDTFTTLNTGVWTATGATLPAVVNGRLKTPVLGTYTSVNTGAVRYTLTGSQFAVELVVAPNKGNGTTQAFLTLLSDPTDATKTGLEFTYTNGALLARRWNAGTGTTLAAATYNPANHRWWRIRESGGTVFWETGPDGSTWPTTVYSAASSTLTGVNLASLRVELGAGFYGTEPNPGVALWDNANIDPADPAGSVDVGVWTPNPFVPATWATELDAFRTASGHVPSVIYTYVGWAGGNTGFPTSQGDTIRARGAQWCLTWEPWDPSGTATQPTYTLASIINGNHDAYITSFAQAIKAWGFPLWLRWAHEMTGDWYPWSEAVNGNSAGQYGQAWRHIHDIFTAQGVTNVQWVWCPQTTYSWTLPMAGIYPGDAYVDIVGLDGYNWGTVNGKTWETFEQIFAAGCAEILSIAPSKPLHICELACTETGGDKAAWITDMWARLKCRTEIRGFWWFNHNKETDWRIQSTPAATAAYAAGVSDARYASGQAAAAADKAETFTEDFAAALNPSKWTTSGSLTVSAGRLSIPLSTTYGTATSVTSYDLTASQVAVELAQPSNAVTSAQVYLILLTGAAQKTGVEFLVDAATTLRARRWVNNVATEIASAAYSATSHRWWRITESAGTVSWQTSPDGTTWAPFTSASTATLASLGVDLTSIRPQVGAGTWQAETSPGTAAFDNVNTLPAAPPPPPPVDGSGGRRNLAPNPACKVNATGWSAVSNTGTTLSTWVRSTSVDPGLPRTTGFEGSEAGDVLTPRAAVTAGQSYYWAVSVKAVAALSANMLVNYYTALSGGSFVANSGATVPLNLAAGATGRFVLGPYTVPATATAGYLKLNDLDGAAEVTAYQVESASTFGAYFDGDTIGASWDGAAGNSTSTIRQLLEAVRITESFGRSVTAAGPVTSEPVRIAESWSIQATGFVAEALRIRESFLITSLEWDPARGRNRVSAFVFGPQVVRARVSRRPVRGGTWQLVRGGTVDVVNGRMTRRVDDYEFPSGVDLEYRIEGLTGAAAGATVVQVATVTRRSVADSVWLKFITSPALNRRLEFMGRTDISRDSRTSVYQVQGRPDPVVVSDVHSSRQFTIEVKTETPADTEALDHALSQGLPCYLQVPATINTPSIYATIGSYSFKAPTLKSQRNVWTIPLTEVAPPPASLVPPNATWQQILDQYPTWDDVLASVPTWLATAD